VLGAGFTRTPVSIEKVYKAPAGFNAKILNIAEETFEYTVPGKIIRINYENYRPMDVGQHYILFVRYAEDTKEYFCVGSYQGKYLINDKTSRLEKIDSLTPEDMEAGECGNLYREILKDIIKKYK
jgi:hypothetical protein